MLKLLDKWFDPTQELIERILWTEIFLPIQTLFTEPFDNSMNVLLSRIRKGLIRYRNGEFTGEFNIPSSMELSKYAKFDSRTNTWKGIPPENVIVAAMVANREAKNLNDSIYKKLDQLQKKFEDIETIFHFPVAIPIDEMDNQIYKDLKGIGVIPDLTSKMKITLIEDYNRNQTLNIKNWAPEQINRLRDVVSHVSLTGLRRKELVDMIMSEWGVSKNKAKFLARQETSLFMSKLRRERNLDAGINKYMWMTSNDRRVRPANQSQRKSGENHRRLHRTIQIYGDPPIVNMRTGRRAEPGEDFNCRCVAKAIL